MDINFPLILVILVFFSGVVALIDKLFLEKKRQQDQAEPIVVEYSKSFFPVLLIVLVLRSFIVEPFQIPSTSMVPTLEVGDFILVNKFTYGIRLPVIRTKVFDINDPKRGDVMVFFPPHEKRYFIKRVIGLPGDRIDYIDNQLFVNGEKVSEELQARLPANRPFFEIYEEKLGDALHQTRKELHPRMNIEKRAVVVPEGHYYMMGDNRNNSSDSRVWGPVPEENIVGKAFAIWMHWEGLSSLPSFSRVGGIH